MKTNERQVVTRREAAMVVMGAAGLWGAPGKMTSKERVERAWKGQDVDRAPFSLWHHFGLEKQGPEAHARATLAFHKSHETDLVKVMSDFPFPKAASGRWWEVKKVASPFAPQLKALEMIRDGIGGKALFVETLFNPYNVVEKMSSKEEAKRMMSENPQRLLDALEAVAQSEANHARAAVARGAAGIFLAIANSDAGVMTLEQYRKFSEPFDRIVLDAVKDAQFNVLHIHGAKVALDHFLRGKWGGAAVNYSEATTGVRLGQARAKFSGVLLGGIDEVKYRNLSVAELRKQMEAARQGAGKRFVLTPGCSVPDATPGAELDRMKQMFG